MQKYISLIFVFIMSGCGTTFSNLKPVSDGKTISIKETYSYKHVAGLARETWHYGLVEGDYISTVRNDSGVFYLGPPHSVIILYDQFGERFTETGVLPTEEEKIACCHGAWFNDTGGFWVPDDNKKNPKLFLITNYNDSGVKEQADSNLSSIAPAAHLTGGLARSLMQGKVVWGPEIEDETLLQKLVVH
ncbi:hypothetical protein [Teredinibacter purpureus]|uniref:hypothetical protein n=1 Tax=Teredinibacter purpureus TaxID=2731756 RepID=UPI0005F7D942|nr:hypothetical protein [Teredinibacter purpureus]